MPFPCSVHSEEFNVACEKFPFQVFLSFMQNWTAGKKTSLYIKLYSRKNCLIAPFPPYLALSCLVSENNCINIAINPKPFSNWKVIGFCPQRIATDCCSMDMFLLSQYCRLQRRTENYHKNQDVFCCISIMLASTTQTRAEKKQPFGRQPTCSVFLLYL